MKIFVINLAERNDRLREAQIEIQRAGLELEVVTAVTPSETPLDKYVTEGVSACWESHRKCFRMLLDSAENYAVIFEDDFEITNIARMRRDIEWATDHNVDLLQFGFLLPGVLNHFLNLFKIVESSVFRTLNRVARLPLMSRLKLERRLRVLSNDAVSKNYLPDYFSPGTHSYIISRKLAESALLLNSPQFLSADEFFISLAGMRTFKIYRSRWSTVTQSNSAPSISRRFVRE